MTALHKVNVEGSPLVNHLPLHPLLGTPRLPVCLLSLVCQRLVLWSPLQPAHLEDVKALCNVVLVTIRVRLDGGHMK